MISNLLDMLFGCTHKNYSFPITAKRGERRSAASAVTGTYVVCLECGKEFPYDWREMRVVSASANARNERGVAEAVESFANTKAA